MTYLSLGHMKVATRPGKYFIPHHMVVKHDSYISKLRVVFDASAKSSSGISLNDIHCIAPKLQKDISELLLTCRLYKYIFISDIVKIYHQIKVRDKDACFNTFFGKIPQSRRSRSTTIDGYISYGLSTGPFLAIRVLHARTRTPNQNSLPPRAFWSIILTSATLWLDEIQKKFIKISWV